jgi:hypothetical protein
MFQDEVRPVSRAINILDVRFVAVVSKGCHSGHKLSSGCSSPLCPLFRTIYYQLTLEIPTWIAS